MESIDLYSTHCPKCNVLESKLKAKNITFNLFEGKEAVDFMKKLGFFSAPVLRANDEYMDFSKAIEWVNNK